MKPTIEKLKQMYPVGTKFIPAHTPGSSDFCIITDDTTFKDINDGDIYAAIPQGLYDATHNPKYGDTNLNRVVWCNGVFAKIIEPVKSEIQEFKKGDYIVVLVPNNEWDNRIFKQREDNPCLKPELNLKGSTNDGWSAIKAYNSNNWRYATPNEIGEYIRLGKPFDVTTLKTEVISEYVECIKSSEFSDLDNTVGKIYKVKSLYTNIVVLCNNPNRTQEYSRFKPSTKEAFDAQREQAHLDTIIEQAKIKFPEGTKYYPVNKTHPNGDKDVIGNVKGNIEWWINNSYKEGDALCSSHGSGIFYYKGKWAEIMQNQELTSLPEKWFVRATVENRDILRKWRGGNYTTWHDDLIMLSHREWNSAKWMPKNFIEITFEQFKKWVMKEKSKSEFIDNKDLIVGEVYASVNDIKGYDSLFEFTGLDYQNNACLKTRLYLDERSFSFDQECSNWTKEVKFRLATLEEKDWHARCLKARKLVPRIQKETSKPEVLVFGKFRIGDIIVSLTDNLVVRRVGDIFKVLETSTNDTLVYIHRITNGTPSDWRAATSEEIEAYNQGVKNIKDIKVPRFEIGKWYKYDKISKHYYKPSENSSLDNGSVRVSEDIYDGKYRNHDNVWSVVKDVKLLTDLSEIQEYLPDGHPDKIPTEKSLVGRYIKWLKNLEYDREYSRGEYCKITKAISNIINLEGSAYSFCNLQYNIKKGNWELMPEGFEPPTSISVYDKTILEECKRRFPIGTKYYWMDRQGVMYKDYAPEIVEFIPRVLITHPLRIEGGNGYLYADGKFTEVFQESTNIPSPTNEQLKIGDWVIVLSNQRGGKHIIGNCYKIVSNEHNPTFKLHGIDSKGKETDWYYDNSGIRKALPHEISITKYTASSEDTITALPLKENRINLVDINDASINSTEKEFSTIKLVEIDIF